MGTSSAKEEHSGVITFCELYLETSLKVPDLNMTVKTHAVLLSSFSCFFCTGYSWAEHRKDELRAEMSSGEAGVLPGK